MGRDGFDFRRAEEQAALRALQNGAAQPAPEMVTINLPAGTVGPVPVRTGIVVVLAEATRLLSIIADRLSRPSPPVEPILHQTPRKDETHE